MRNIGDGGWSTGHYRSLMDLGGTVDCRRVVDESCSPIFLSFARTTDYNILRHPRCLQRLLYRPSLPPINRSVSLSVYERLFRIVIVGIWFTVRTSARHSSRSTFDPPPAYIIPSPVYTGFGLCNLSSNCACFWLTNHIGSFHSSRVPISCKDQLPQSTQYLFASYTDSCNRAAQSLAFLRLEVWSLHPGEPIFALRQQIFVTRASMGNEIRTYVRNSRGRMTD
ncbi:hypothetical protein EDD85DRAFT_508425 [Armillaria nabsnona]|nr:hypothetical protein EDD85DRAFT_508425 [Armillaria nabsnona]